MSTPPRRTSDGGRLQAWVVVLVLAFAAVALQQSHRYKKVPKEGPPPGPPDVRTTYRNALYAFEFYCEQSQTRGADCDTARVFLRSIATRRCDRARETYRELVTFAPEHRPAGHPLGPSFRSLVEVVCPEVPENV